MSHRDGISITARSPPLSLCLSLFPFTGGWPKPIHLEAIDLQARCLRHLGEHACSPGHTRLLYALAQGALLGERSRPPARAPIGFRTREGLVDPLGRPRAPHPNVIDPFRIQGNILPGSATPSDLSRQSGTQRGPSAHTDSMRNGRQIRPLPSIGCGICCNPPNTMNIVNPIRQGDCLRVPYAHCPFPVPALGLCVRALRYLAGLALSTES